VIRNSVRVRTSEAAPRAERHYVLLIHVTFSAPEFRGRANWFYPDPNKSSDNFCTHLSNLLADGDLGAESVWRPLPDANQLPSTVKYPFYWDVTNMDQGRKDGEFPVLGGVPLWAAKRSCLLTSSTSASTAVAPFSTFWTRVRQVHEPSSLQGARSQMCSYEVLTRGADSKLDGAIKEKFSDAAS
jgi:hypothetical protein